MNITELGYEILGCNEPMKHIERIARVCYKSEDKIGDGTDRMMVKKLFGNGHHAMLEHFRFIMEVPNHVYWTLETCDHPYIGMTASEYGGQVRYVISASARGIIEMCRLSNAEHHNTSRTAIDEIRNNLIFGIVRRYDCPELFGIDREHIGGFETFNFNFIDNRRGMMSEKEWAVHGWMSVLFRVDRGISHELVRHRPASFAQESTRYCNYGGGLQIVDPCIGEHTEFNEHRLERIEQIWRNAMQDAEIYYNMLVDLGVPPQDARSVLPNATKTDITVTATICEWEHIFRLRAVGVTGKPHPMMQKIMSSLYDEYCLSERGNRCTK